MRYCVVLVWLGVGAPVWGQQSAMPGFEDLLRKLSPASPEACGGEVFGDPNLENQLFVQADQAVIQTLNDAHYPGPAADPRSRVVKVLEGLEQLSAPINHLWPEESRFHAEVTDVSPGLVVTMTVRSRATFSFFAIPENDAEGKPTRRWDRIGYYDPLLANPFGGSESAEMFPLQRGPSGKARFLARVVELSCGSGRAISYTAYEWDPRESASLSEIIKVVDSVNEEEPIDEPLVGRAETDSFGPIGKLKTEGPRITLPYCWFSAIDTWDNPSLCAVDTYDISGDRPRFISTVYNRPDILPIARVLQYAGTHDYLALRAYCGSDEVAQQLLEDVPPSAGAEQLSVLRTGESREIVKYGEENSYSFEVEKTGDRWVVVSFQMD